MRSGLFHEKVPGSDLLSHGEAPHYHRRWAFSLLSSEWDQVVPARYGRQAILKIWLVSTVQLQPELRPLGCYMVKPHGQLVSVS